MNIKLSTNQYDALITELLDALESTVMRLEWINHPASGNTESQFIKYGRKAITHAAALGFKPTPNQ